ncbi:MAG: hypothetical protein RL338_266 [Chloroflexota bacterium]
MGGQAPLHVLVVARWYPSFDDPGRGSFVADHVAALVAAGHRVTVASFDPTGVRGGEATRPARGAAAAALLAPALGRPEALGTPSSWGAAVPVARLPAILDGSRRRAADVVEAHARALVPFGRALSLRDPLDVIHAHTGLPDGVAALRLADDLGLPLLTTEHSSTVGDQLVDRDAVELYRRLVGEGRSLVAVGPGLAAEIEARTGLPPGTVGLLPNAVPVADFPPGPASGRDAAELLFVGSRKASKGIELLLRAVALARGDRPELRLRLVGPPGPPADEERWTALAAELGIIGAVTVEGRADRPAVAAAMRRAGLFVHPSPRETFGVVAVEALASGLPVAATPSGGVEAIVADRSLGEIAAGHDPAALAGAIVAVVARRGEFDARSMHDRMAATYAAPVVADRTVAAYRELIGARSRRPADGATDATRQDDPADGRMRGRVAGTFQAPLVVGLSRELIADRLAPLPAALRERLTVATHPGEAELPPALVGTWVEIDPERDYRERLAALGAPAPAGRVARLARLLSAPGPERERRRLAAARAEMRIACVTRLIREAWVAAGRPGTVLALDADDLLAVRQLLGPEGPALAPGGLRWLVDAWDAAGR